MRLPVFFLILIIIIPDEPVAQDPQRQITARIIDTETKKPVKDVRISARRAKTEATSNALGYFQLAVSTADTIDLVCPDYENSLVRVPDSDKFQIQMTKKSVVNSPRYFVDEYEFDTDEAHAKYYRIVVDHPSEMDKSLLKEFRMDHTPRQTWAFVRGDYLTKEGKYISYHSNGMKASEGTYKANARIDRWTEWYESGKIKAESLYDKYKDPRNRLQLINYWDSLGNQLVSNGNGLQIIPGGGEISYAKGQVKNGVRSGEWSGYFSDGKVAYKEDYENGRLSKGMSYDASGKEYPYEGGERNSSIEKFYQFMGKGIRYPMEARRNKIEGTVIVHFLVDPDGKILKTEVAKGIGGGCDEEAIRVVKAFSGKWDWGKRRGQGYKPDKPQSFSLPLVFKMG